MRAAAEEHARRSDPPAAQKQALVDALPVRPLPGSLALARHAAAAAEVEAAKPGIFERLTRDWEAACQNDYGIDPNLEARESAPALIGR